MNESIKMSTTVKATKKVTPRTPPVERTSVKLKKEYEKRIEELTAQLEYANECLDLYV